MRDPFVDFEELRASFLTSSENLSAPVARDARARLVVFAATLPKAAASLRPELKAANATCSAALIASWEAGSSRLCVLACPGEAEVLLEFGFLALRRGLLIRVAILCS